VALELVVMSSFLMYERGTLNRPAVVQCQRTLVRSPAQLSPVNYCWSSPAQSFVVSGHVMNHEHTFVHYRLLCVLKWGLIFYKRRDLTIISHSPSAGE
jgi:hypothetical protein